MSPGERLGVAASISGGRVVPGDVRVADGRVTAIGLSGGSDTGLAAPGLIDLQVNGYAGVDILSADEEALVEMSRRLLADGVTAYQPSLITSPPEHVERGLRLVERVRARADAGDRTLGSRMIGAHLEGPFLSPLRSGTHPVEFLSGPDIGLMQRFLAAGRVTEVTMAPELPGGMELLDFLVTSGVVVAVGHSDATAQQAGLAFNHGATTITHLFNAMRPLMGREPGLAGVALTDPRITVKLIADGVHLDDLTIRLAWHCAAGRIALVSDCVSAAGLPDGDYMLGTVQVRLSGGAVKRSDGTIAGSAARVPDCLRRVVRIGVSLVEAMAAASRVPARLLGLEDLGTLEVGSVADIVVFDGVPAEAIVPRSAGSGRDVPAHGGAEPVVPRAEVDPVVSRVYHQGRLVR